MTSTLKNLTDSPLFHPATAYYTMKNRAFAREFETGRVIGRAPSWLSRSFALPALRRHWHQPRRISRDRRSNRGTMHSPRRLKCREPSLRRSRQIEEKRRAAATYPPSWKAITKSEVVKSPSQSQSPSDQVELPGNSVFVLARRKDLHEVRRVKDTVEIRVTEAST